MRWKDMDLELIFVTNTHSHFDHTAGNRPLLDRSGASFLDHRSLIGKGAIELDGERISIHHTPGHTENEICPYRWGCI
jgi:hydroxyacylglutathione hydrolase